MSLDSFKSFFLRKGCSALEPVRNTRWVKMFQPATFCVSVRRKGESACESTDSMWISVSLFFCHSGKILSLLSYKRVFIKRCPDMGLTHADVNLSRGHLSMLQLQYKHKARNGFILILLLKCKEVNTTSTVNRLSLCHYAVIILK